MKPVNKDNQGKWLSLAALVGLVSLMSFNSILLTQNGQQQQQQQQAQVNREIATAVWTQFAYY